MEVNVKHFLACRFAIRKEKVDALTLDSAPS